MDDVTLPHQPAPCVPAAPALPMVRREPLLRGPLILTAISRVLFIPFYLLFAVSSSIGLRPFLPHLNHYSVRYFADKCLLVGSMWVFTLLSVLLAWLFFSRRQIFRPLMIYFCVLFLLLLVCVGVHINQFPSPHRSSPPDSPMTWPELGLAGFLVSSLVWPFYYAFSPRVKRVFTR